MKNRRRLFLALVAALVGLIIWQVISASRRHDSRAREVIPGVGTLYFERAEYGTQFAYGSSPERLAYRLLGSKWGRKLGLGRHSVSRHAPVLWIWLMLDRPKKDVPSNVLFKLGDENGFYAQRTYGGDVHAYDAEHTLIGVGFGSLPRESRLLQLAVHVPDDRMHHRKRAEFTFANPLSPTPRAPLPVKPLPLTAVTNGLEITLQRLAIGGGSRREFRAAKAGEEVRALAAFQFREGGVLTADWKPVDVTIKDRWGQESRSGAHGNSRRDLTNYYQFTTGLWPDTNGMRFAFEFARENSAAFAPGELLELRGIKAPAAGKVTVLNLTTNILGHEIKVVGLFGDGARLKDFRRSNSSGTSLEVEVNPPLLDKRLNLVRMVDDQGRTSKEAGKSWSRPSGRYGIGVEIHNTAKEVDLTLAVHPSLFIEFGVAPELLKP